MRTAYTNEYNVNALKKLTREREKPNNKNNKNKKLMLITFKKY